MINADRPFHYRELTHELLKCAFEVHNTLGCGFLEKVYVNAFMQEMKKRGVPFETKKHLKIYYKGEPVGDYYADMVVEDKVILEFKVVDRLSTIHKAQLINYLKATGFKVGLILNFAKPKLEYKRLVVTTDKHKPQINTDKNI